MRVTVINDGMYPYRTDTGGTWTHRLVRGLPEHTFDFVTITDRTPVGNVFYPPANTVSLTPITLEGPSIGPRRRRAALTRRRAATHTAVLMCRSMLADTPSSVAEFGTALRQLAAMAGERAHSLHGVPLTAVLSDAWRAAATRTGETAMIAQAALPEPSPEDVWLAANLLERAVRPLSTPLPGAELNHAADAGLAALVALGAKWRTGTPFVLTEHRTYLDAPLLDHTYGRPAARAVLLRFFRALARVAYQEAAMVAAPTEQLRCWAADHGADRDRLVLAPYGVDPHSCTLIRREPADPIIVWLGPERDLATMVAALPIVRTAREDVRVLVAGPAVNVFDRRYVDAISFLGPASHRRSAYANGQIVVLSSAAESMPYALIEAMMCGRPTIVVDDGALTNVVGMGAIVVPPDDPGALAWALITLLADPARRRQMSVAAGQRARNLFALRATLDRFREVYARASGDASAPTEPIPSSDAPTHPADASAPSPAVVPKARPAALTSLAAKLLAPLPPESEPASASPAGDSDKKTGSAPACEISASA